MNKKIKSEDLTILKLAKKHSIYKKFFFFILVSKTRGQDHTTLKLAE